jgi:hypothetical protein
MLKHFKTKIFFLIEKTKYLSKQNWQSDKLENTKYYYFAFKYKKTIIKLWKKNADQSAPN